MVLTQAGITAFYGGHWPNVSKAFPAVMGQAQFGPTMHE